MKIHFFTRVFIALSVIYLLIVFIGNEEVAGFLKPLLLLPLFFGVVAHSAFRTKKVVLSALAFSWIGDVILLFTDRSQWFFIIGLIAFLIAHIFYFMVFYQEKGSLNMTITDARKPAFVITEFITVVIYLFLFLLFLIPHLGPLQLPVCVYAVVISSMLLMAIFGQPKWSSPGRSWILLGAISFVISDSLLAINKFYEPYWQASFFIMLTYLFAQFGIVRGLLLLQRTS